MKIAITYDSKTKEVFQHFGKTENYLVYDTETKEKNIIDNGGFSHKELIPYLSEKGIEVIICGGVGTPAIERCKEKGIRVIPGITGSADAALLSFLNGTLSGDNSVIHECGCHHSS